MSINFFFSAEGKGSKKEKAKEDAATEMIRLIVNEQNAKTLSSQLKPFDEQEYLFLYFFFSKTLCKRIHSPFM